MSTTTFLLTAYKSTIPLGLVLLVAVIGDKNRLQLATISEKGFIPYIKKHLDVLSLALVFVIISGIFFSQKGVVISNDSPRYINYAYNINRGIFYDDFNFWYTSYAIFLSVFTLCTDNFFYAVLAQYLICFAAILCLYGTAMLLWRSRLTAFCGCLLFMFFLEPLSWNSYILTESLYVSFICFSIYLLSRLYMKPRNNWLIAITILTIVFTFFLRPNGICLIGAIVGLTAIRMTKKTNSLLKKVAIIVTVCTSLLLLADVMLANFGLMENYSKGEVIYAITTLEMRPEWQKLVLTPPSDIVPINSNSQIIKVSFFFAQHPAYFIQLAATKAFYFFIHIRPYWSTVHNLFSASFLITCYVLVTVLLFKKQVAPTITQFALLFVILQGVSVCLTSEDWDGRFLMPILPVIFLLAGHKISLLIRSIFRHNTAAV